MEGPKYEKGIVVGNTYDKYGTGNPVARRLVDGFLSAFDELVECAAPRTVLEVGCGPGDLSLRMARRGYEVLGTDLSDRMIRQARERAAAGRHAVRFDAKDLFDLDPRNGIYDLVVCCEVLEHLEEPEAAVRHLSRLARTSLLFSVPWEPMWRVLNVARGRYWSSWGNTPGHLQHWSRRSFLDLLDSHLDIDAVRTPLPWTMALTSLRFNSPANEEALKGRTDN